MPTDTVSARKAQNMGATVMKIRMLESRRISTTGFDMMRLEKGKEYELPPSAAAFVLRRCWGVELKSPTNALFDCFQSADPLEQIKALNDLGEQLSTAEVVTPAPNPAAASGRALMREGDV